MNVLKQCCYRSLKENRKRTVVTIVGVILATALVTGVACMAASFRVSLIAYEKYQNGDYHYTFREVQAKNLKYFENNKYIESFGLSEKLGYAMLAGSSNPDKPYIYVSAIDEKAEQALSLHLSEGRMPDNDSELVIGRHIRSNGMVDLKVGDTLTLSIGNRMSESYKITQGTPYLYEEETFEPAFERTFTIVGIIERPTRAVEPFTAPGYSVFTRLEDVGQADILDVYASYTDRGLRQRVQVTAGILGVTEELYESYYGGGSYTEEEGRQIRMVAESVDENYWLLKWEVLAFSSSTMNMLYAMAAIAILIIIVTSVFCIHNSFVISLTEKMKLYGRLSSVGTTARQQKKIVYYEAAFLGIIGIPLGVLSGVGASAVLVKVVGGLVEDAAGFELVFAISLPAILLSVLLSGSTVFLSASGSAKKAAKISPISAIRANDTVRIRKRELRCPGIVGKIFGIGGRIAYKNLRRARVKYRTTVVSIVVSVAAFIGMNTFVGLMFDISGVYNKGLSYQIRADVIDYGEAMRIAGLDEVQEAEIVQSASVTVDGAQLPFTKDYLEYDAPVAERNLAIRTLGEEAYARYCSRVGVDVEEARDKAIVVAVYHAQYKIDGKIYLDDFDIVEYHRGDVIQGVGEDAGTMIEVLVQTREKPMYLQDASYNDILLIVSDSWLDSHPLPNKYDNIGIYMKCEDSDKLEEIIRNDMMLQHFTITNYDAFYRAERSLHLVIAIFLYGFITVVVLIGVTNIFNTITTNMELRAPEFAMLRSVGMTGREFRRMIWLEGMFYGGKALVIGIPLGILISFAFHIAMAEGIVTAFRPAWGAVFAACAAVAVLLFVIMHYSMAKINRKDIIETIQNENI